MSKIVIFVLIFITSLNAVEWLEYDEALKQQQESKKIIMIGVVRSECHYCHEMQERVFDNSEMSVWLEKRFILVKVNIDEDTIPLGITTSFTPSFFFVNRKGEVVKKIPGAWNIEDFKSLTKGIK